MTTIEQSLREDNDVLRRRIREVTEVNERANEAIADLSNEYARFQAATFKVTTQATLEHVMRNAVERS